MLASRLAPATNWYAYCVSLWLLQIHAIYFKTELGEWGWLHVAPQCWIGLTFRPSLIHGSPHLLKFLQLPSSLSPCSSQLPFAHTSATEFIIKFSSYLLVPLLECMCLKRAGSKYQSLQCPTHLTQYILQTKCLMYNWWIDERLNKLKNEWIREQTYTTF